MGGNRILGLISAALAASGLSLGAPAPAQAEQIIGGGYGSLLVSAPFAVALERGEFAKNGVEITGVLSHAGGGTGVRNLLAGELPYGDLSTSAVLAAYKNGVDVRIVSSAASGLDLIWVTMPDSPIKSIGDLVGKKVGVSNPKSTSETLAKMALEAAGLPMDKVAVTATGGIGAGLSALEAGGVDVAVVIEPLWSGRKDRYRKVFDLGGLPPMTHSVGVTTAAYAKANPGKLKGIIAARRAAVDFIYANPEEAARMIAKQYGDTLPVDVAIGAVKNLVAIRYWDVRIDVAKLDNMLKGLERQGEWSGPGPWDKLIDRSFLPSDLQN